MSITIRLAKVGRKRAPAYKIVVTQTRDKRNGKFLDVIGHFNPSMNPTSVFFDEDKFNEWIAKGALTSKAVEQIREGTYVYKPYNPKADAAAAELAKKEADDKLKAKAVEAAAAEKAEEVTPEE